MSDSPANVEVAPNGQDVILRLKPGKPHQWAKSAVGIQLLAGLPLAGGETLDEDVSLRCFPYLGKPPQTAETAHQSDWSKPAAGLRARLSTAKAAYSVGEAIEGVVELQCVEDEPKESVGGCQLFPHLVFRCGDESMRVSLPIPNRLRIPKGMTYTGRFKLSHLLAMDKLGRYTVQAGHSNFVSTDIGDWSGEVLSPPLSIELVAQRTGDAHEMLSAFDGYSEAADFLLHGGDACVTRVEVAGFSWKRGTIVGR